MKSVVSRVLSWGRRVVLALVRVLLKLIRWVVLGALLGGGLALSANYGLPSYDKPAPAALGKLNFPPTNALQPIPAKGVLVDLDRGTIMVALEIAEGADPDIATGDILAIYRWGRSFYRPPKCGPEYPAEMCRIGSVTVFLVAREQIVTTTGPAEGYVTVIVMVLDQIYIDRLLDNPPETFDDLVSFHRSVAEETERSGGFIQAVATRQPFTGF